MRTLEKLSSPYVPFFVGSGWLVSGSEYPLTSALLTYSADPVDSGATCATYVSVTVSSGSSTSMSHVMRASARGRAVTRQHAARGK